MENFRRRHANSRGGKQKSITQIFDAEYRPGDSSCFVSWENFYDVFEDN
jgi:hypothetical protein